MWCEGSTLACFLSGARLMTKMYHLHNVRVATVEKMAQIERI